MTKDYKKLQKVIIDEVTEKNNFLEALNFSNMLVDSEFRSHKKENNISVYMNDDGDKLFDYGEKVVISFWEGFTKTIWIG